MLMRRGAIGVTLQKCVFLQGPLLLTTVLRIENLNVFCPLTLLECTKI